MKVKLAKLLLRRKELNTKVDALKRIKETALFEVKAARRNVTESVDDIVVKVPLLTAGQVTRELDWHQRQLRECDAAIQQTNWTVDVEVDGEIMSDYKEENPPRRKDGDPQPLTD